MADRISVEHYVGECFVKCAQVILGSRIFQAEHVKLVRDKRSARWFMLEVEELAGLSARLDPWRRDVYAPLVIEVYIQPWDTSAVMPSTAVSRQQQGSGVDGNDAVQGMLLERWTLSYSPIAPGSSSNYSRAAMDSATVYKHLILLIRSLYSYVRVLPAYRMYRSCKRQGADLFNTQYTLGTMALPNIHPGQHCGAAAGSYTTAVAGSAGRRMCQFHFSPVETVNGQFGISVEYQPATAVHFLEQTSLLPCTPRIISDYVDGPYARSAPNNSTDRVLQRAQSSTAAAAADRPAGEENSHGPSFLRSQQQQHTPLVRHSWSSKNVAAPPVVLRGFNPLARSNSLNANSGCSSNASFRTAGTSATATSQQQQQQTLHRRSPSQGCSAASAVESSRAAVTATATAVAGSISPVVFQGPSSIGRPPLPHSPATAAAGQHHQQSSSAGHSSMLHSGSAIAAAMHTGSPSSSSVSRISGSPLLLRTASAGAAAAVSSAAAAAAAAAGVAATALTSSSLGSAAAGHLSRLSSSLGASPRVLGFGLGQQQQQRRRAQQLAVPQATQQGFHVKRPITSCRSDEEQQRQREMSSADVASLTSGESPCGASLAAEGPTLTVPAAVAVDQAATYPAEQQQQQASDTAVQSVDCPAAVRAVSAPVMIPGRGKGKARSVTDLPLMEAEMQQQQQCYVPAVRVGGTATGSSGLQNPRLATTTSGWADHTPVLQTASTTSNTGATYHITKDSLTAGNRALGPHQAAQIKQQQHTCQQMKQPPLHVQVPSSAPAAPRGMLGQLLSGQTSPPFSPPGVVTTTRSGGTTAGPEVSGGTTVLPLQTSSDAVPAGDEVFQVNTDDDAAAATSSTGTAVAAAAPPATKSNAIIICLQPPAPGTTAAAAAAVVGCSPSSSSHTHILLSRTPSHGYSTSLGGHGYILQPHTPGGGNSNNIYSCSPQLPFAFTPSQASLGMSMMSLADQHRQYLLGAASPASGAGTPNSRDTATAGVGSTAAAGSSVATAAATGISGSLSRHSSGLHLPRTVTAAVSGSNNSNSSSATIPPATSVVGGVGTPSPPPHVSCVRDISGLATIRRPSWSSRSSSFDVAAASVSLPHQLSESPMMAADLLDPALLGCSSSQGSNGVLGQQLAAAAASGRGSAGLNSAAGASAKRAGRDGVMTPAVVLPGGFEPSQRRTSEEGLAGTVDQASTGGAEQSTLQADGEAATAEHGCSSGSCSGMPGDTQQLLFPSAMPDESESDILPFAIDTEACGTPAGHVAAAAATGLRPQAAAAMECQATAGLDYTQQAQDYRPARYGPTVGAGAVERDVAVGAFVKLIQEASAAAPFQRARRQQQQQQQQDESDSEQRQQQSGHQQLPALSIGDAVQQVQQLAAQLQALVFDSNAVY